MAQLCCVERSTIFNERYSQKWDVIGSRGSGVSKCSGRPIFIFFFIKENWICAVNRHHTEPNNNIDNKSSFWLDVRQWSHPLMIPLHCLWANSSNSMRGQLNVTCLFFCFDFVCSLCGCCSLICLRFQVVQIKEVYCKMSTKNVNSYK